VTLEPAPRPWCVDEDDRPTDEPEWVVSWSALPIQAHLYTRLPNSLPDGAAAFLCSARDCCGAKTLENDGAGPTAALDVNKELVTECAFCLAPRRAAPRHKGGTK